MLAVTLAYVKERRTAQTSGVSRGQAVKMGPAQEDESLPIICELPEFTLTNQFGKVIGRDDLADRVWLVDIIFTRCPGPCAAMTRRMAELQSLIPSDLPVGFLSLTTDPEFDTPSVLEGYGNRFEADFSRWHFVTGTKADLGRLAADGLKLVGKAKAEELRASPDDLFIHSTVFALVDSQGRLRGVKETMPPPASEDVRSPLVDPWETELKPGILRSIEQLLKEDSK